MNTYDILKYMYDNSGHGCSDFFDIIKQDDIWNSLSGDQKLGMYNFFKKILSKYHNFYIVKHTSNRYDIDCYISEFSGLLDMINNLNYDLNTYNFLLDILCDKFKLDINNKNKRGYTPVVNLLTVYYPYKGADKSRIGLYLYKYHLELVKSMVRKGVDVDQVCGGYSLINTVKIIDGMYGLDFYSNILDALGPEIKDPGYD